ncbi:MAG: hypothetical protein ACPGUF_05345, partial [Litorivicinus sp.]
RVRASVTTMGAALMGAVADYADSPLRSGEQQKPNQHRRNHGKQGEGNQSVVFKHARFSYCYCSRQASTKDGLRSGTVLTQSLTLTKGLCH